ncbi:MAG: membrane protein insertase YidC, partial [Myxococcales bacterium]|nr:membrane protein insertase YidC [Myxococcales bacterium]
MDEQNRRLLLTVLIVGVASAGLLAYQRTFQKPPTSPAPAGNVESDVGGDGLVLPERGDGQDGVSPAGDADPDAPERSPAELVTLRVPGLVATASPDTAALRDLRLTDDRFVNKEGKHRDLATANKDEYPAFRMDVLGVALPNDMRWRTEQLSESAVRFQTEAHGFEIVRKLEAGAGPYQVWSTVRITNRNASPHVVRLTYATDHYVHRLAEGGGMFSSRSPELSSAVCITAEDTDRVHHSDKVKFQKQLFGPNAIVAAVENTYFASAMAPAGEPAEQCRLSWFSSVSTVEEPRFFGLFGSKTLPEGTLYRAELRYPRKNLAPGESVQYRTLGFLGPKSNKALHAAGHGLPKVIDLGWFSAVAEYLVSTLAFIYGYVGNWGVAIILMTILFKLLFFPLTWGSFKSLAKMKVLKPEMDRINELYGDDSQKKGAAMMELYRKHGVNPLGGCLPQLLQMPVWIAFFASLSTNTELYRAHFALQWTDLSAPDPYFVLPLVQGLLLYVQQRMTPTSMDPAQAKMMMYF